MIPTALYRFRDASGELLYVGVSMDIESRFSNHKRAADWWQQCSRIDMTWYPTRADALVAESAAIDAENPRWNRSSGRKRPQVVDDITRKIESGEWPPGRQLPTKIALAAEYKVSTAVIDAAMIELRLAGLVRGQQGKGVYVAEKEA